MTDSDEPPGVEKQRPAAARQLTTGAADDFEL
jgi:hypothetical protein